MKFKLSTPQELISLEPGAIRELNAIGVNEIHPFYWPYQMEADPAARHILEPVIDAALAHDPKTKRISVITDVSQVVPGRLQRGAGWHFDRLKGALASDALPTQYVIGDPIKVKRLGRALAFLDYENSSRHLTDQVSWMDGLDKHQLVEAGLRLKELKPDTLYAQDKHLLHRSQPNMTSERVTEHSWSNF